MLAAVMSSLLSPGKEEGLVVNFTCGNQQQQHTIPGCLAVRLPSLVSKYQQRPQKWHSSISFARLAKDFAKPETQTNRAQKSLLTRGITWPKTCICKKCIKKHRHQFPTSPSPIYRKRRHNITAHTSWLEGHLFFQTILNIGHKLTLTLAFPFSYRHYK